jgi:phosphoribosyl-AMP cyclohydrolase
MLTHNNDYLLVGDSNAETLINEVLAAFDFYNTWEQSLWEASDTSTALQEIINLSENVFGFPARIMGIDGRVLAISERFGPDDVDERWKQTYETRFVQLRSVSTPVITPEGDYLPEWDVTPKRYCAFLNDQRFYYIAANIKVDDEVVAAFMMQEFGRELSDAQCQLAAVFCEVLQTTLKAKTDNGRGLSLRSKAAILHDLLEGQPLTDDYAKKIEVFDCDKDCLLISLQNILGNAPIIRTRSMLTKIREFAIQNITLEYNDQIISVICNERRDEFIDTLLLAINPRYYLVGLSLPFRGWGALPLHYRQASFAIDMGAGVAGVYNSKDYAYQQLVKMLAEQNSSWEFCHPGVLALQRYDEKQHTEFARTLYHFIANERSLTSTSRALHIHRNTLIYRIKRINELLESDLQDPDERMFIYISFQLLKYLEA